MMLNTVYASGEELSMMSAEQLLCFVDERGKQIERIGAGGTGKDFLHPRLITLKRKRKMRSAGNRAFFVQAVGAVQGKKRLIERSDRAEQMTGKRE